jgi:hypothetical protein
MTGISQGFDSDPGQFRSVSETAYFAFRCTPRHLHLWQESLQSGVFQYFQRLLDVLRQQALTLPIPLNMSVLWRAV